MNLEEKILERLEHLTREVEELKAMAAKSSGETRLPALKTTEGCQD